MMKYINVLLVLLCLTFVFACEEESAEPTTEVEAVILGQDETLWACGGGWIIKTSTETVSVFELPNEDVVAILTSNGYTGDDPLEVMVAFDQNPESTCAIQFGNQVKELISIRIKQ